ncbi:hypothetical protein [Cohnella sp. REN36]|uniref:hypothetical protein n=1 Tax=Cohnella sp. REN36 TaxID=2887347 RepID=UPI001D15308E|nr:hypothetical protein [Cohnella sp. REN36]MCC3374273.1 hypothetical protein [Cohnella sp. REN36]
MVRRRQSVRRAALLAGIGLLLAALLASCAQGQAHLTVHLNGTADLDLNASASKTMLKLVGKPDLPGQLADALRQNGMEASVEDTGGSAGIRATRRLDLKTLQDRPSRLPDGMRMTLTKDERYFFARYHVSVDYDASQALAGLGEEANRKLAELPAITKQLAQSQIRFDLLLTTPIRLRDHNADETRDGGRTLVWHAKLLENNHIELGFPLPNVRHIANVGIPALLALVLAVAGTILFWRKRRRRSA